MTRSCVPLWAVILLAAGLAVCDDEPVDPDADSDGPDSRCAHDDFDGPGSAGELVDGAAAGEKTAEGLICPVTDHDWYRLTVPEGDHLLDVNLYATGPGSPIQPTYVVYGMPCDDACLEACAGQPEGCTGCCTARAAPLPSEVGGEITVQHCLEPGDYYIVIRDQNDDGSDWRTPRGIYRLTVSSSPDPDASEPNDGPDSAVALAAGSTARGAIACRGDQDWYAVEGVGENQILGVQLDVPIAGYQPQVRIVAPDDTQLGALTNAAGTIEPTTLSGTYVVPAPGRYYVVVGDDDNGEADSAATYALTVTLIDNNDPYEPNNTAVEAEENAVIDGLSCGASWSSASRPNANLAATNDIDVFQVNLSGCANGILEATVTFDGPPDPGLEPSVRIVRAHTETPCAVDSDCRDLMIPCAVDDDDPDAAQLDCSGFGNNCLGDVCAGASMCLPGSVCGANVIERHPNFCGADGTCHGPEGAMRNRRCADNGDCAAQDLISTAIPIGRGPGGTTSAIDRLFVVVSDFGSNAADPSLSYTLQIRTRADPDTHEPNELYNPFLSTDEGGTREDTLAKVANWTGTCVTGTLSYERDRDWFVLPNPCPGTNCTFSVSYDVDAGPVEAYVYASGAWDNLTNLDPEADAASNPARSGSLGGSGDCLPSNSNLDDPIYIVVRDMDLNRDFSADQSYSVCFSGITAGCGAPCITEGGLCWYPPED